MPVYAAICKGTKETKENKERLVDGVRFDNQIIQEGKENDRAVISS